MLFCACSEALLGSPFVMACIGQASPCTRLTNATHFLRSSLARRSPDLSSLDAYAEICSCPDAEPSKPQVIAFMYVRLSACRDV